ncbi:hypothetical protein CYMTET_5968 [Cymbomonas tetramitiformis]|uniref:RNA-directed DNA polymerase n=1 Tax=Cymbomonas tetramitiformis TaxID=36881 RepID=A0AAE0GYK6_9CHLO|nr:hypothetical protein CYMTET_5968 [Cymbomonas tetramitiformis]
MLPSRAMTSPPPAPERQVVEARLRKEAKSPVCTSEDLSDDSQHVEKRHRRTLKVTESYRVHLEPTGQPLQGWQFRAVRGQGTSALRSKVGTRGLRSSIKALETDLAPPRTPPRSTSPPLWRAGHRRSSRGPTRSPTHSAVTANKREARARSPLPAALNKLKRLQEYRRRRQDIQLGRRPRTPSPNDSTTVEATSTARSDRPRPWLSPTHAARAEGAPRRRWLSGLEKVRQREKLKRDYASGLPYLERDSPMDEELLHILAKEQAQEEVEDGLLQYASDLATNDMARAAKDKVIQVALYPPDHPPRDLVQTATAQGLLADAGTYELPWDSDMDDPPDLGDPHAKDDPFVCQLNSIIDSGDMSPGWSDLLAAVSTSRAPPRQINNSKAPTLLLFWAYVNGRRVKVLVDSGCSTNIISDKTVRSIPSLTPRPHENPMRVRVADGASYDVNTCVRPRLQAETTKGLYVKQLELRVMPIDLCVDIILGGPWLASHSPVTLDYSRWGSIRFGSGSKRVVITGCSPGTPDPSRPKDKAMALVQGVLLDPKRVRKDLRALQSKDECAFVVYLAPDGTFGAVACNEETDAETNAKPMDASSERRATPSSEQQDAQVAGAMDSSQADLGETDAPALMSASDTDSEAEDALLLRESVRPSPGTSDEDHLDKVYATVESTRPQNFDVVALEGAVGPPADNAPSNNLHLGFFQSKREALGAFALLPEHVRAQAIDDHAQGKPPTWHAEAAAALEQGRRLLRERRPRRKRVRWSDEKPHTEGLSQEQAAPVAEEPPSPPPKPHAMEAEEPDEIDETVSPEIWQQLRDLEEEFRDVICTELPDSVQSRDYKNNIRLRSDWSGQPLHRRNYKLSQEELRQLRAQLDELLAKGYIRPSASPWGCPVLMVPKPSNPKELRLVIDYRSINEITVKDKYPLPDVQTLLDDLQGATVFSTADALWGFWQVPMEQEDIEKTAMTTHFGAYEWLVMPMGLSNSPSTWQRMMTQYLGHLPFCRVFVDDIMIFSDTPEQHVGHVRAVLAACRQHKVYLKRSKLKLCMRAVRFLGHVCSKEGCRPQRDKVASVRDWPELETVTHVRQFLGMCGFYRRYIQSFAHIAHPLTRLTKMGVPWTWGKEEKEAFQRLKSALISAPILALPDQRSAADGSRPFCVQTDASAVALGGVLMQDLGRGLQPLAFESRQFSSAEQNYHAGERELCAIHHCTTVTWRHYLIFTDFKLMGDHKPLQWLFAPARELSRRQARWYEDLVEVGVHQMEHVPGRCLVVPDAQSRRPDYKQSSAREGLKEKGVVDRDTDEPRQSVPRESAESSTPADPTSVFGAIDEDDTDEEPSEEPAKVKTLEDPISVLDSTFDYSDSEDESVPPVSPPMVVGELTHLNGLTWVETPDLWEDAAETLHTAERALHEATLAGVTTRSRSQPEQAPSPAPSTPLSPSPPSKQSSPPASSSHYDNVVDRQDWKLVKEKFEEISAQYGPFDVDACCDSMGVNRQVDTYWTECLKQQWRGKHVWCNPPYTKDSNLIERILRHFMAEWRADPENTSAMFLLPDYDASWRTLIQPKYGLHVVKVFDLKDAKGHPTCLFESPDGGRPALRWPVLLVWAPAASRTRPRAKSARAPAAQGASEPMVTSGPAAKARATKGPLKACQFVKALRAEYERSPYLTMLKEELLAAPHQRTDTFRMVDDMIWRIAEGRYQLVLSSDSPLREIVMREAHESPAAGHTGRDKTLARIVRRFWWPRMNKDVTDWTRSCLICQQTRPRNSAIRMAS